MWKRDSLCANDIMSDETIDHASDMDPMLLSSPLQTTQIYVVTPIRQFSNTFHVVHGLQYNVSGIPRPAQPRHAIQNKTGPPYPTQNMLDDLQPTWRPTSAVLFRGVGVANDRMRSVERHRRGHNVQLVFLHTSPFIPSTLSYISPVRPRAQTRLQSSTSYLIL